MTRNNIIVLASVALFLPIGAAAQGAPAATLDDLAFMAGCWRGDFGNGAALEEFYSSPSANLIVGTSRFLRDGRTVQFEFSRISSDTTGITLLPFPDGRPSEHGFRLTMVEPGNALFEAPEHDFPKRIRYARTAAGGLTARIDGGEGDSRVQEWRMEPVACRGEQATGDLTIDLARDSEAEALMARELRALLAGHDVEAWILTRSILIDERSIPHSHPVLTIHTRHIGDEAMLLSTFVHEQLHWLEDMRPETWAAAMADLRALFPDVPSSSEGGASNDESTYRHLLVCDMEYQAMTELVGQARARETLGRITHYEWIYDRVLNDPRVRAVSLRHGFDVSEGAR